MPTKQSAGKKTESNDEKTIKRLQGEKKKLEELVKILSKQFDFKSVPNEVIEGHLRDLYEEKYKVLYEEMEALKRSSGKNEGQPEKERAETAKDDARANKEIGQLKQKLDEANANTSELEKQNQILAENNRTANDEIKQLTDELDKLKKENDTLTAMKYTKDSQHQEQTDKDEMTGNPNPVKVNDITIKMKDDLEQKSKEINDKEIDEELNKRVKDLDSRESQIKSKEAKLEQKEKDSNAREEELNGKATELKRLRSELEKSKTNLEKRETEIGANENKNKSEQDKLQKEKSELDKRKLQQLKDEQENRTKNGNKKDTVDVSGLESKLKNKEDEVVNLNKQLSEANRQIEELQTKDKTSTDLRNDIAKKQEEIEKLNRKNEELQTKDKTSAGLKDELGNKEKDIAKLNKALTDVKSDLKEKEKEVEKLGGDLSNAISKLEEKKAKVDSSNSRSKSANVFRQQLEAANHEIEELKTRLSKVMGANITNNNPDIADLSDLNRPTKLAEKYSELYDNEWTDAFEEIENNGVKEVDAIKRLFDILKDVYKFCNQVSVNYTKSIKASALLIPGTDNGRPNTANLPATSRKQITELRKTFAPSLAGDVFKQYLKATKQSLDKCPQTKRYIKACVDLCWLMSIQDPPVVLDLEDSKGSFDGDKYKSYTKTGKTLDFVVWPPLRLHDGGALLSRGVAQGK